MSDTAGRLRPGLLGVCAAILAGGTLLAGCGGRLPQEVPVYEDLVLSGSLAAGVAGDASDGGELGAETTCADETRFAVPVPPGTEVELPLTLGAEPRLLLSACSPAEEPPELRISVAGRAGLATEASLRLSVDDDGTGWTERTVELASHAGAPVTLRLSTGGTGTEPVYVADLAVRHRVVDEVPRDAARRRRVLLISVDTLRADDAGTIGGVRGAGFDRGEGATPALDAFAREAEVWTPHYAAANWTKPSHASLLTGLPPAVHRAYEIDLALPPGATTLAERFSAAGYRTAGLVYDCDWLDADFGFDRGFEGYRSVPWHAGQAVRAAANWLGRHRDEDVFYFLHLFTPHSDFAVLPYESPGTRRETAAAWLGESGAEAGEDPGAPGYGCRRGRCASQLLVGINEGAVEPLPGEAEVLRRLYRRGVSDVDRALGRLFRDLREAGLWETATVVVTSDHGEAFLEHGSVLHETVHEEIVRVPLAIKWPEGRGAGHVREVPSSALDVAPTLLAAAGIEGRGLPGVPLSGRRTDRPVYAGAVQRAAVVGPWKVIFDLAALEVELYRLDLDPGERHNLAGEHPERVEELLRMMLARVDAEERWREVLAAAGAPRRPGLTEEERRRLRGLGYLD